MDWVGFNPRHYEERPYVTIELIGFDLFKHSINCADCKAFLNDLNSDSIDWFIEYSGEAYRLSMKLSNTKSKIASEIKTINSHYQYGTFLRLIFHELPLDKNELWKLLKEAEESEDFERCIILRDTINGV